MQLRKELERILEASILIVNNIKIKNGGICDKHYKISDGPPLVKDIRL